MDLEVNGLFPRRPVFKFSIKCMDADYLRVPITTCLEYMKQCMTDRQNITLLSEVNMICSGLWVAARLLYSYMGTVLLHTIKIRTR